MGWFFEENLVSWAVLCRVWVHPLVLNGVGLLNRQLVSSLASGGEVARVIEDQIGEIIFFAVTARGLGLAAWRVATCSPSILVKIDEGVLDTGKVGLLLEFELTLSKFLLLLH